MKRLDGKVALITGGGKGIGYGLSRAFAKNGANLVITGRTESALHEAAEKLRAEFGVDVLCVPADGAELPYSDAAQIADYARQPVALLTDLGVLSGSGDGMLHPQSKLTREQALKLAVELLAALNG